MVNRPQHSDSGDTSSKLERRKQQFSGERIVWTSDPATDRENAELVARQQIGILRELEATHADEQAGGQRADMETGHVDTMDIAQIADGVQSSMKAGNVDYIVLRDGQNHPIGHATTQLMPLSSGAENDTHDATLFIWLVGIDEKARGTVAIRVLFDKIMEFASARAVKNNLHIKSVFMEGGRNIESISHKLWGARGVYMKHGATGDILEVPYIPPPTSVDGGIITEDPDDPHSLWLLRLLDEGNAVTPEEFLRHSDLIYKRYTQERTPAYVDVVDEVQEFIRDLIAEVCDKDGKLSLLNQQERQEMELAGTTVVAPKHFSGWLESHFPALHNRFRAIVGKLKIDYD